MGRGKVEIKRIENNISRQVTFSKRRAGLLKKARELSVLCDAEIAVIIFSSRGRIYPFSSLGEAPNAIEATIERYYRSTVNGAPREEPQPLHYCQELAALRAQYEHLKQAHRQLLGEDLVGLGVKQLELLEKQLESALDRTRHTKERQLGEINMKLKIEEGVEAAGVQLRMMNEYQQQQHQLQLHLQPPHHLHLHPGGAAGGGWSFGGSSSSFDATAASQIGCYKPEPILEIGQPYFSSLPHEEQEGPSNPSSISHPDFHGWFH